MKTYKNFIEEMAVETGINGSKSRKYDWDNFYKDKIKELDLIKDKLGSNRFKVYKAFNVYFLIDEKNDYKGHIELSSDKPKIYHITDSNSDIKSGFYSLMFSVLLSTKGIDEILSDNKLSTQAIKSYLKLNNRFSKQAFNVRVKIDNTYIEASKEHILNNRTVFSITERYEGTIKETFKDFDERFNNKSSWYHWYENNDKDLDMVLFMEKVYL